MDPARYRVATRPFGHAADLDLAFARSDRPRLVTALLAQCTERPDPTYWWSSSVGARIETLLRILVLTEQRSTLALTARCREGECGRTFELELPLEQLPRAQDEGALEVELGGDRVARLRRPTGEDLRRWNEAQPTTRADAVRLMLAALVVSGEVAARDEGLLAQSLARLDPLVSFEVLCACPDCGAAQEVSVDLEGLVLLRLAARQRELLREVHRLASRYGWTEAQILAIPAERRAQYLAQIESES